MRMVEALEWAADFAERSKIFQPVRNERGYADGWKPPTPAERAAVIKDLAETAVDESSGYSYVPTTQPDEIIVNAHAIATAINKLDKIDTEPVSWGETKDLINEAREILYRLIKDIPL